jgi:hypothetical protein
VASGYWVKNACSASERLNAFAMSPGVAKNARMQQSDDHAFAFAGCADGSDATRSSVYCAEAATAGARRWRKRCAIGSRGFIATMRPIASSISAALCGAICA